MRLISERMVVYLVKSDMDGGLVQEEKGLGQRVQQPVGGLVRALDRVRALLRLESVALGHRHLPVSECRWISQCEEGRKKRLGGGRGRGARLRDNEKQREQSIAK